MTDRKFAGALQVPPHVERLYQRLRAADGATLEEAALGLMIEPDELLDEISALLESGVVSVDDGVLRVSSPGEALAHLVQTESRALTEAVARLTRVSQALPALTEELPRVPAEAAERVDAEVMVGGSVPDLLVSWIERSRGDVLLLRADQWALATEPRMFTAVAKALAAGRVVRSIYPVRALTDAPKVLLSRAAAGEQVRVLPEVPTRLAVVGTRRALFPDPPGTSNERRIVMRHPGVVVLLTAYFDALWDRAVALPMLRGEDHRRAERRLLLSELARGSRDEQIARTLGMSLRTVRRRIAELMIELGADTRFQAGLEASRRGWF